MLIGAVSLMKSSTLDRQTAATFLAGALVSAISVLTNYGHGALLHISNLPLDEQIGVSLFIAALAALFGAYPIPTIRPPHQLTPIERDPGPSA